MRIVCAGLIDTVLKCYYAYILIIRGTFLTMMNLVQLPLSPSQPPSRRCLLLFIVLTVRTILRVGASAATD